MNIIKFFTFSCLLVRVAFNHAKFDIWYKALATRQFDFDAGAIGLEKTHPKKNQEI